MGVTILASALSEPAVSIQMPVVRASLMTINLMLAFSLFS
jgi:hypothetical protein